MYIMTDNFESKSLSTGSPNANLLEHSIHANFRALAPSVRAPQLLPNDYVPSNYDIICGKGKQAFNHIGNRRFRVTIDLHLPKYEEAKTKAGKTAIVHNIVHTVREKLKAGSIRHNKKMNRWVELGDAAAREKVGQAIRDCLLQRNPERRQAKIAMRRQKRESPSLLDSDDIVTHTEASASKSKKQADDDEDSSSSFEDEAMLNETAQRGVGYCNPKNWFRTSVSSELDLSDFSIDCGDESKEEEPKKSAAV
jgi:hypothetical protein